MKKIISLCLVAVMLLSAMIVGVAAEPTVSVWNGTDVSTTLSGSGTEEDPYLIQSAADLKYLEATVNKDAKTAMGEYSRTSSIVFSRFSFSVSLSGQLSSRNQATSSPRRQISFCKGRNIAYEYVRVAKNR